MKVDFNYSDEFLKEYYIRHAVLGLEDEVWLDNFKYKIINDEPVLFDVSSDLLEQFYAHNIFIIPDVFKFIDDSEDVVSHFTSYFRVFYLNNKSGFTFKANGLLSIPDALFDNTCVKTVYLNNCEELGSSSFASTYYLDKFICPNLKSIYDYAFSRSFIRSINIKSVEFIGSCAFYKIHNLYFENIDYPNLVHMSDEAFLSCESIKTMIAPKLEYITDSCFKYSSIETFIGESVLKVYKNAFKGSKLAEIQIPNVKIIGEESFEMTQLESFELCTNCEFDFMSFANNFKMKKFILKGNTIVDRNFLKYSVVEYIDLPNVERISNLHCDTCKFISNFKHLHLESLKYFDFNIFEIPNDSKIYLSKNCVIDKVMLEEYKDNFIFV